MRSGKGYLPDDQHFPSAGLNTLVPSTMLDAASSPAMKNVMVTKGIISKRRGYRVLGGGSVNGTIMAEFEFETASGVKHLVVVTTTKQYRYDATSDTFINITYQFAAADVNWTGGVEDTVQGVSVLTTDGKYLIFTNGVDKPRKWDGSTSKVELWEPDIPDFVTCKTIASFYNHIMIGNVTTSAAEKQTVYWSVGLELEDFTNEGSGVALLTDASGQILRLEKLGDRLLAYCENSISMISYLGGELLYSFEELARETKLISSKSIINVGPYHFYMSLDNIYMMDGSRQKTPIGDLIHRSLREEIYLDQRHLAFAFNDVGKQQIYWFVPNSDTTSIVYVQEYDVFDPRNPRWTMLEFADRPTSMATFSRDATILWNSQSIEDLLWENADFSWRQASVRAGYPTRVFASGSQLFINDDTITNDDGAAIEAYWDSKDFVIPKEYQSQFARWTDIELEMEGYEIEVYYSTDQGQTYQLAKHLNLSPHWKFYRVNIDVVSRTLRVRLVNNCVNSNFNKQHLRVWFRPAGPR